MDAYHFGSVLVQTGYKLIRNMYCTFKAIVVLLRIILFMYIYIYIYLFIYIYTQGTKILKRKSSFIPSVGGQAKTF